MVTRLVHTPQIYMVWSTVDNVDVIRYVYYFIHTDLCVYVLVIYRCSAQAELTSSFPTWDV